VYGGPELSQAEFRTQCAEAAREGRDAELKKVGMEFDKKLKALQEKLSREQRELAQDESEHSQRKMEEMGTHAENIFGLFAGRRSSRRISSSLSKRRMTEEAKADVDESKEAIADLQKQIAGLESEKNQALAEVQERWEVTAGEAEEISLSPLKKDVVIELFGVAWYPYHILQAGGRSVELPAYHT
jgi:phage terminase Nu1 subunit (DNA packaging protein)